jgi:hypothetical protein
MADAKGKRGLDSIHSRTVTLEKEAGELGDTFLQYLYRLARLHIEEQVGIRHEEHLKAPPSKDADSAEPDE